MEFDIHIPNLIGQSISDMVTKTECTVNEVNETNGIFDIVLDSERFRNLRPGMVITNEIDLFIIESINFRELRAKPILENKTISVGEVLKLFVSFHYDRLPVLNKTLSERGQANKHNFPLIWLMLPIEEQKIFGLNYSIETNIKLSFAYYSKNEWVASQRFENVIQTILMPLVNLLINELMQNNNFYFVEPKKIEYREIKRYRYGADDKNKNVLNQIADAIEIEINNLKIRNINSNENCYD